MEELDAMWDGDANEAFNALVTEDKPKFERLAQMMETYKTAIDTAASKYDSGEAEVKNIVSSPLKPLALIQVKQHHQTINHKSDFG